jgi:hypothetical protein
MSAVDCKVERAASGRACVAGGAALPRPEIYRK